MRHRIAVVLVLVTVSVAHAARVKTATGLIRWDPGYAFMATISWEAWAVGVEGSELITQDKATSLVASSEYPKKVDGGPEKPQRQLSLKAKYQKNLVGFTKSFIYVGESVRYASDQPFLFCDYEDRPCLVINAIASENTFNSVRLNSRQRATRALETFIPGAAKSLLDSFQLPKDLGFFIVTIVYGSKDFTNDYASSSAEAVSVVAKAEDWAKFAKAKTTIQEFLKTAGVYSYGMGNRGIKMEPQFTE